MYVCIYVYMYICMYKYVCVYIYMYTWSTHTYLENVLSSSLEKANAITTYEMECRTTNSTDHILYMLILSPLLTPTCSHHC